MAHVGHGALIGRGTYRAWHIRREGVTHIWVQLRRSVNTPSLHNVVSQLFLQIFRVFASKEVHGELKFELFVRCLVRIFRRTHFQIKTIGELWDQRIGIFHFRNMWLFNFSKPYQIFWNWKMIQKISLPPPSLLPYKVEITSCLINNNSEYADVQIQSKSH